jgi:hypothetical protein
MSESRILDRRAFGLSYMELIRIIPKKGKRLIALHKNNKWYEVYEGESLIIRREYLYTMQNKGFVAIDGASKPLIYNTPEEAENAN